MTFFDGITIYLAIGFILGSIAVKVKPEYDLGEDFSHLLLVMFLWGLIIPIFLLVVTVQSWIKLLTR